MESKNVNLLLSVVYFWEFSPYFDIFLFFPSPPPYSSYNSVPSNQFGGYSRRVLGHLTMFQGDLRSVFRGTRGMLMGFRESPEVFPWMQVINFRGSSEQFSEMTIKSLSGVFRSISRKCHIRLESRNSFLQW